MTSIAKQVALNTLSGYVRLFTSFGVLLFLTPFIISKIGQSGYGLWSLVFSIISFFELLDFGFSTAVIKYVAEAKAKLDLFRRNLLINTALVVYFIIALISLSGIGILIFFFDQIFSISSQDKNVVFYLLGMMALRSSLLGLPFSVFRGILFGEQKIYVINLISLFSSLVFAVLAWFFLKEGWGILGLGFANIIAAILENLSYLFFAFLFTEKLRISIFNIDIEEFKKLFFFSYTQFVSNISTIITYNGDLILINLFLPLEYVGLYAVPLRIVSYGYILIKQFTNVLTPVLADFHAKEEKGRIRNLYFRATKLSLIPSTAITVGGLLFAHEILTLWVGNEFVKTVGVLSILLFSMWLTTIHLLTGDILQYCGFHRLFALFTLIAIFAHIFTSAALIVPFGLNGVACGVLATSILGFFLEFRKVCDEYEIDILHFFQKTLVPFILPALLQALTLILLKVWVNIPNLWVLALINLLGFAVYFIVLWLFCLEESDKKKILHTIKH